MKLLLGFLSLLLVFSCKDQKEMPQSLCDCFDVQIKVMEEAASKGLDAATNAKLEQKYEAQLNICDKLAKEFDDKIKELSNEEQIAAQKNLLDNCESYKVYAKKNEQLIQQEMQGQENPFEGMSDEEILDYLEQTVGADTEQPIGK